MHTSFWEQSWGDAGVLNESLGIASGDPVQSIFNSTTMPFVRSSANDTGGAAERTPRYPDGSAVSAVLATSMRLPTNTRTSLL